MRIHRLDICGFKSFMDRMTFVFDEGVTGVVGPNGCGKSNVVDAIRWVMGEQSAKHLRGKSMEDVIFNGSESHAPLSMAEVSLTFLNDGSSPLPAEYAGFTEITITRRLFRNGDSEYLINKTVCRLLDITELFLGTGVGTKAYSIIEQGRIGLIVSSKPEDRRAMIEEAAGVTKYKSRRKAAERKMEYTEQNLLRVGDILGELGKRLDSLSRAARKAEKYKALKGEMREIELHLSSVKHLELGAHARATRTQLESLSAEETQLTESMRTNEETLTARRAQLVLDEQVLTEKTAQLFGADGQLATFDQRLLYLAREESETNARIQQALLEAEALRAQLEAADRERAAAEKELNELAEVIQLDEGALTRREQELREVSYAQSDASRRLEGERAALVAVITSLAQHQNNLSNLSRQRLDLAARLARLGGELDTLRTQAGVIESQRVQLHTQLDDARAKQASLTERKSSEETALTHARTQFSENEARVIGLRDDLSDKRSRLNAMVELARNYEGYDRGVRAVMLKAGEDLAAEGIEGLVSDLLGATEPRYEIALEAALGYRLQAVVVRSREHAEAAMGFLKSAAEGRSAFVPVEGHVAAGTESVLPTGLEGSVVRALEVVKHAPRHESVVRALLGTTVIVENLAAAYQGASQQPGAFTFVTLGGEVLDPQGVITGGTLEGPGAGALQRKREIQDLGDQVKLSEEQLRAAQAVHQELSQRAAELDNVVKSLTSEGHEHALAVVNQERDLSRASEEVVRFGDRIQQLEQERGVLLRSEAELSAEEASSQGQSVAGEAERQNREQKVGEVSGELDGLRIQSEQVATELTQVKVKLAGDAERRENLTRTLTRIGHARGEQVERELRLAQAVREGEQKVAGLAESRRTTEGERAQLAVQVEALRTEVTAAKTGYAEQQTALAERDAELKALRQRLSEATAGRSDLSIRERELQFQLTHLSEQIRERYALELEQEVHRFHTLPMPDPDREQHLVELRSQVERMGEINLTAIDEHAELSQRFEFLSTQRKDLEDSISQLRGAIVKIDETSQERFKETFEKVNERFMVIFPRLFAGGKAHLTMVTDPITREQGVEIYAQPPGKALKSVNLLSGGEKALTAVSVIFSIFLIKPTPFCFLDEVDAPLDDANVGRYNEMIREMSQQSQFILITHNKRTMEIADSLYGVTMEEPGVSKLVNVRLTQRAQVSNAG